MQSSGKTTVNSGTTVGASIINLQGGTFAGQGLVSAPLINSAILSPGGSPGVMTLAPGKDYQQTTLGTLRIEVNGTSPGSQYDQLVIAGNATLSGGLQLLLGNGFTPRPGDQFQILTCASQSGSFSSIDAPVAAGTLWVARYLGTNVTLVLADQLTLTQPSISGGLFHLAFNTTAGLTYVFQASDMLNPPNWQILETRQGDGTIQTVIDPTVKSRRIYRIVIQ